MSLVWEEFYVMFRCCYVVRFLDDVRICIGIIYGLMDYWVCLCSEGEVVVFGFGNYFFVESVYEIILYFWFVFCGFIGVVEIDQFCGFFFEGVVVILWNYYFE